ncbi:uncharacterized protein LOC18448718 isoform X2 [Amborella trichopoda]|nr:uncharacterized protein LOC18448718 isoform X2 [Amborella trichopoda]|eukprot:XP_020531874.1 uncharacterized protein LOC18448718 isoform X2 [Amborella trichopoda]
MLRTRLLSFSLGFTVAGAAITHFMWKDLWKSYSSLSSMIKERQDALEIRVSKVEAMAGQNSELSM